MPGKPGATAPGAPACAAYGRAGQRRKPWVSHETRHMVSPVVREGFRVQQLPTLPSLPLSGTRDTRRGCHPGLHTAARPCTCHLIRCLRAHTREKVRPARLKTAFFGYLGLQGELFRARTHISPSRANFFAQKLLTAWRDETVNTNARTSARLRETRDSFAHQDSAENGCFCLAMVPSVSPETEHAPAKVLTVSREPTRRTLLNAGCLRGLVGRGENAQPCPECAITVDVVPMQRVSLEV